MTASTSNTKPMLVVSSKFLALCKAFEENMKNSANDVTADSGYFFIKVWEDKVSSLATFF